MALQIIDTEIIPQENYDKIVKTNKPNKIIIVDSSTETADIITMNKIHKESGLICFAFHYFIDRTGKIFRGRYEFMYPAKVNMINDFTNQLEVNSTIDYGNKEIISTNRLRLKPSDYARMETLDTLYICLEGNTNLKDATYEQYRSVILLCKDILARRNGIMGIYGLFELIPSINNPGIFLKLNKIRSEALNQVYNIFVNTPSGNFNYSLGSRNLYYNPDKPLSGNDIALFQKYLTILDISTATPNGIFDLRTFNSVKTFQAKFDLPIDGIVMKEEFNIINESIRKKIDKVKIFEFGRLLEYREGYFELEGQDVSFIQKKLKGMGLYKGLITGKYTKDVMQAVIEFQRYINVVVDGKVGPITFKQIMVNTEVDFKGDFIYDPDQVGYIEPRDDVRLVQKILRNHMKTFGLNEMHVNGIYDEITMISIKKVQLSQLLYPSGIVDEALYNFIKNY